MRDFVRNHLALANVSWLFATFAAVFLDFISPGHSGATKAVYVVGFLVAAGLLLLGLVPARLSPALTSLVRRPAVRAVGLFSLVLVGVGVVSIAYADQGKWLASHWTLAADAQKKLLGDIETGVKQTEKKVDVANGKLDIILASQGPGGRSAGDACPNIDCAIRFGARRAKLEELLNGGARLPVEPHALGAAFAGAISNRLPVRIDAMELYLSTHTVQDINAPVAVAALVDPRDIDSVANGLPQGVRARVKDLVNSNSAGCRSPVYRMVELAAVLGDKELFEWLVAKGANSKLANSWCTGGKLQTPFSAERLMAANAVRR